MKPYNYTSPLFDEIIATDLVELKWANKIIIITVKGTLNTMPTTPQIAPQIEREIKATRGLIFNEFPSNLGSKK